ncbi:MAG: LPS export ABC transporter periplasmic protein LptC, partial [Gammaproteobacteria bacterium]|nr:LPS export ABC transporter periplasmic protein LptC [Gammaproteobacteria bacterium]
LTSVSEPPRNGEPLRSGFYLKSARILGTDDQGKRLYEIEAEYAEQQPNNEIQFDNVQIEYAVDSGIPWTLNADTAIIGKDRKRVRLSGHVIAVSNEGFGGQETEIRTPYLELQPENFVAETDERVQIRIGSRSLTATGMLAMLENNRVQLKSNVSGKFVP